MIVTDNEVSDNHVPHNTDLLLLMYMSCLILLVQLNRQNTCCLSSCIPTVQVGEASAFGEGGREFDSRPGQTLDFFLIGKLAAARQAPDDRVQCYRTGLLGVSIQ